MGFWDLVRDSGTWDQSRTVSHVAESGDPAGEGSSKLGSDGNERDVDIEQDRARVRSRRGARAILATARRTNGACGAAWWPTGTLATRRGTATSRSWCARASRSTSAASSGRSSAAPEVTPSPEVPSRSTPTTSRPLPLVKRYLPSIPIHPTVSPSNSCYRMIPMTEGKGGEMKGK